MLAIFKREIRSYFLSPVAYVFIGAFFILAGMFFMTGNILSGYPNINGTLSTMQLVLTFITPILTMKLLADERKTRTDQLLLTSPVSLTGIVMGKFLAALFVFFVTVLISLIYVVILFIFGSPSVAELINNYLGFFLVGMSFIAISIFASSVTDSQIIAAIVGFASILSLWIIDWVGGAFSNRIISDIVGWLSIMKRSEDFANGILKPASILYYISFSAVFIFLTIRVIDKRRWSEG
ncbi:MAG: ABC transporter permease [Clostridia bacterium]|nr:ABC transporter permease [Clostridia bacterium]